MGLSARQTIYRILKEFEETKFEHFVELTSYKARILLKAGLLQKPDDEPIWQLEAAGKRLLQDDFGTVFIGEIAAFRQAVEQLDRQQIVSKNEKKPEEQKPTEQTKSWQRYVTPKYEDTVLLAIRIDEDTRDKFHAVMRAKGTNAQDFIAGFVKHQVDSNPDLVEKGSTMQAQGHKRNYRTKLQMLKEENAHLRERIQSGKPRRSL